MPSAIISSASVAATTVATSTPGAVSSSVALPSGNAIVASSVTSRSTRRNDVSGSESFLTTFGVPGRVLHRYDDAPGPGHQVDRPVHARNHLARNHPVGESPVLVDLQPAKHGHVDVPHPISGRTRTRCRRWAGTWQAASDRATSRTSEHRMRDPLLWHGPGADHAAFRLEVDGRSFSIRRLHVSSCNGLKGRTWRAVDVVACGLWLAASIMHRR